MTAYGADVKTFDVPSAAMGETVKVSVVTPASYAAGGTARYPVVYLLHGAGNDHTTYLQPFLMDGVDKWRFIAVIPDGKLDWWMDSPLLPKVRRETFVVNELVPWVDSKFRTLPQRQRRAVAGHSMGGQGAMRLGMRHADVFGIVGNVMGGVDICAAANRKELVRLLGPYAENEARWRSFSVLAEAERWRSQETAILPSVAHMLVFALTARTGRSRRIRAGARTARGTTCRPDGPSARTSPSRTRGGTPRG